ncbi:MAG TPA: MerC family mercury resistance protein [Cyclobacteriaceae bacterium]
MQINRRRNIYWADKLVAVSAFLCIIHCLAVPTLLALGLGFLGNPIISYLFITIAFISIFNATKNKVLEGKSIFLWSAFVGFVLSLFFEEKSKLFEYGTYLFSIAIIVGHLMRMKYNEAIPR